MKPADRGPDIIDYRIQNIYSCIWSPAPLTGYSKVTAVCDCHVPPSWHVTTSVTTPLSRGAGARCTCIQSSMSQESFNHQVLKIMRFHKPTNKPMLRSLQWSTWNIVKSQEYFARPKYYVSPEKIHQPSGISIYWWHLEPVVSGLSVSWAMWHEAVMAGKYESMGGNSRDTGARAPGDQSLVTAPDCREDKTWD